MRKQNSKISKILLCLLLTAVLSFALVACNGGVFDTEKDEIFSHNAISPKATTFVGIDINPSIEFILDQNDMVLSVASANDDGLIMLWKEDGIVGANLQVAIKKITQLALDYGYLNKDNNVVNISVTTIAKTAIDDNANNKDNTKDKTNDAIAEDDDVKTDVSDTPEKVAKAIIVGNVKLAVETALKQANTDFNVVIGNGIDIALSYELEKIKNEYKSDKVFESIDVETYRLIKRAMAYDSQLSLKQAVKLGKEQLLSLVRNAQANATNKLGKDFEKAQAEAQFAYENKKQALTDRLFVSYFLDKLDSAQNFGDAYDLIAKIGYATQYDILHEIRFVIERYAIYLRDFLSNPVYQKEDVQKIYDAISLHIAKIDYTSFINKVCDADGCASLEKITAYINSLYRKCSDDEKTDFFNAYSYVGAVLDELAVVPEQMTQYVKDAMNRIVDDAISSISIVLGDMLDNITNSLPVIDFNDIHSVQNALPIIDESMNRAYTNMKLSSEDFEQITIMQDEIKESFEEIKQTLNEQISVAKATAIQTLDEKKIELGASIEE